MEDQEEHLTKTLFHIISIPTVKYNENTVDKDSLIQIEKTKVPTIPSNVIKHLKTQCATGFKFHQLFSEIPYEFDYNTETLNNIISHTNYSQFYKTQYSVYILHSFLKFMVNFRLKRDTKDCQLMLSCLLFDGISQYKSLLDDCFFDLLGYMIRLTPDIKLFDSCFNSISDMFHDRPKLPTYSYAYLPKLLSVYLKDQVEHMPNESIKITTLTSMTIQKHKVEQSVLAELYNLIHTFLVNFDLIALSFFSDLCLYIDVDQIKGYCASIPILVWSKIVKTPQVFIPPEPIKNDNLVEHEFSDIVNQSTYTAKPCDRSKLCDPEILKFIVATSKICSASPGASQIIFNEFHKLIESKINEERIFDLIFVFIRLCSLVVKDDAMPDSAAELLLHSQLFDGTFNAIEREIGTLSDARQMSVELILKTGGRHACALVLQVTMHPKLFAEVAERMCLVLECKDSALTASIADSVDRIFRSGDDYAKTAASHLFFCAARTGPKIVFECKEFSKLFFRLFSLNSQKNECLELFKSYSARSPSKAFVEELEKFFSNLCADFPNNEKGELTVKLLSILSMDENRLNTHAAVIDRLSGQLCRGLTHFDPESRRPLFDSLIEVVCAVSTVDEPSDALMVAFEGMLAKTSLDESVFEKLQPLVYDSRDTVKLIRHPAPLKMLVSVFWSQLPAVILKFLTDVLNVSDDNALACHIAEIDLFLADRLESSVLFDGTLEVLKKICEVESSPVIVCRFVSLMMSKSGKVSQHYPAYLRCLCDLLDANLSAPKAKIPIQPQFVVMTNNFNGLRSNDAISFIAWVSIDCNVNCRICSFSDGANTSEFIVSNLELKCGKFVLAKVPFKKWFFINITIEGPNIYGEVDGEPFKQLLGYSINMRSLQLRVGGGALIRCGYIGSHGIFKNVPQKKLSSLRALGCRDNDHIPIQAVDYKGSEILKRYSSKAASRTTFAEALLNTCSLNVLLPIFGQLNLPCADGCLEEGRLITAVKMLMKALSASEREQLHFSDENGFAVITQFLEESKFDGFTFDFYLEFFSIYNVLVSEELRADLLMFLTNFQIWARSAHEFARITGHWNSVLFPTAGTLATSIIPVAGLLTQMRLYCFYEKNCDSMGDLFSDIRSMTSIRHNIFGVIIESYCDTFSQNDFTILLSFALSKTDINQVYDLLLLLNKMASSETKVALLFDTPEFIGSIFELLVSEDEDVTATALDLLLLVLRRGLLPSLSLYQSIEIARHYIPRAGLTDSRLSKISALVQPQAPELFGLVTYLACLIGESAIKLTLDSLTPDPDLVVGNRWCLWSCVAAVRYESLSSEVLDFLSKCGPKGYQSVCACLVHASHCSGADFRPLMKSFFEAVFVNSERVFMSFDDAHTFVKIVTNFLFFHETQHYSLGLVRLFSDSPFANPSSLSAMADDLVDIGKEQLADLWSNVALNLGWAGTDADDTFESSIVDVTFQYKDPVFGLVFDESSGEWSDLDLAISLLAFISKHSPHSKDEFFMCYGFVIRSAPKEMPIYDEDRSSQLSDWCFSRRTLLENPYSIFDSELAQLASQIGPVAQGFSKKCQLIAYNVFTAKLADIHAKYQEAIDDFNARLGESQAIAVKSFHRIVSNLTADHAPWAPADSGERHYKRAFVYTNHFIPMLTKLNLRFDPHIDASSLRDSGAVLEKMTSKQAFADADLIDEEQAFAGDGEQSVLEERCELVTVKGDFLGTFIVTEGSVRIEFDDQKRHMKRFMLSEIALVLLRRKIHRQTAIEIFLRDGRSFFVNFKRISGLGVVKQLRRIYPRLKDCCQSLMRFDEHVASMGFEKQWHAGEISNFDYLMKLNIHSGRSFNDPSQYPFLPWVISDYSSDKLDLSNNSIFRDLTKPVGALGEDRLRDLESRLNDLKMVGVTPFLYSSYAISPLSLFLYLIRVEPFTTLHIDIQGGRFDNAARIFISVAGAYKSVVSQINDYRELIPEFYCAPEFLDNMDGFDLGKVEDRPITDVVLPPWAKDSLDFVYKNRKALESEYVSENMHNWIDLVWGYKQRGEEAYKAHNLYKQEMYDSIWSMPPGDGQIQFNFNEIESMINLVGQIPPQLFFAPHRPKHPKALRKLQAVTRPFKMKPALFACADESSKAITITEIAGGCISKMTYDLQAGVWTEEPTLSRTQIPDEFDTALRLDSSLFVGLSLGSLDAFVFRTSDGDSKLIPRERMKVACMAAHGGWVCLCGEDSRTHVYKPRMRMKPTYCVITYRATVRCCAVSDTFKTVVIGAADDSLVFFSLNSGNAVRSVDVGFAPARVLVTPEWGFVVCTGSRIVDGAREHVLSVHTINGRHIYTQVIEFDIASWTSFASPRGFDFVCAIGSDGQMYTFEVYYGNPVATKYTFASPISIEYLKSSNCICVMTPNDVSIMPIHIDDTIVD